ncbi:MAG: hypothetical protein OCC49_18845 [Fibrobacterales bacterium]
MKDIKYIELNIGSDHVGPAWICKVSFSKSGRSLYFDGRTLKKELGTYSSYIDTESGEGFSVYEPQQDGQDRDNSANGLVYLDDSIYDEYLAFRKVTALDSNSFRRTTLEAIDKSNEGSNASKKKAPVVLDSDLQYCDIEELGEKELNWLIDYYADEEAQSSDKKSKRVLKQSRIKVIEELNSRS